MTCRWLCFVLARSLSFCSSAVPQSTTAMSSSRTHSVQWSPHPGHNAFLVGRRRQDPPVPGGRQLRPSSYEGNRLLPPHLPFNLFQLPLITILRPPQCFDWSPDPNYKDLVAVGYTNGRTVLVRMHATSSYHPSEPSHYSHATQAFEDAIASSVSPGTGTHPNGRVVYPNPLTPRGLHPSTSTSASPPYPALNVRHSRACNVVSFCPPQPHLLATGLDRGRGEVSLMVWDVSQAQGRTADHAAAPVTPVTAVPPALSGAASGVFGHGRPSWADRPPLLPSEGSGARTPGTVLDLGGDGFFSGQ
ncbi:hypothetical protein BC936DRAFT_143794 [Jimgerdemannia flammicorona]|uniref:WD40-repeat-containing domain protein n=1 Tax=Jimgerdemannia flammicorona TaxID=994334 RepID=A0A433DDG5_9FUNG|nr:hypothetical protein BC936DRAFT_143794 [Jimgerdemannia flammicorona]